MKIQEIQEVIKECIYEVISQKENRKMLRSVDQMLEKSEIIHQDDFKSFAKYRIVRCTKKELMDLETKEYPNSKLKKVLDNLDSELEFYYNFFLGRLEILKSRAKDIQKRMNENLVNVKIISVKKQFDSNIILFSFSGREQKLITESNSNNKIAKEIIDCIL